MLSSDCVISAARMVWIEEPNMPGRRFLAENVAEGHDRRSTREFLHFLSIVQGSRAEVETLLHIASQLNYCMAAQIEPLLSKLTELSKMLRGLQKALKRRL